MSTSNEMAPSFGGGFGGFGGFDRPSMPFNPFMMTRGIGYNPNRNDIDDYIRKYKNSDYIRRLPSVQDENCKFKTARLMLVTFLSTFCKYPEKCHQHQHCANVSVVVNDYRIIKVVFSRSSI